MGGRSGLSAAIVLGVLWALAPLFGNQVSHEAVLAGGAGVAALSAAIVIGMAWKVPEASLLLSRQLLRFIAAAMLVEVLGLGGMYLAGFDPGRALVPLVLGYWCVMCLLISVTLVPSGWPTVVAYALMAAAAAVWPRLGWTAATGANLALLLNVLWMRHRVAKLARTGA